MLWCKHYFNANATLSCKGCRPRRTGFFLVEPSSFKKYMYEAAARVEW